MKSSVPQ